MTSALPPSSKLSDDPIWVPTQKRKEETFLYQFMQDLGMASYDDLYQFSIENVDVFWSKVWDFCDVIASEKGEVILEKGDSVEKAVFFPEARLNYAENLLRDRDEENLAIYFFNEKKQEVQLSFKDLRDQVSILAQQLKAWGVKPGDRVAGYMPNLPQTVVVMLAATSLGAVWSSCSPDFGANGVVDRFGQIEPKILLAADGYYYHGKETSCLDKLPEILKGIPSIEQVIVVPYTKTLEIPENYHNYDNLVKNGNPRAIDFAQLPFNHPLFILFSSGTTGVPKCIVHCAGGVLLQHLKEHQLHSDLKPGDRFFYFTTCGWMMWNWLVSGLASRATLILFDGNPFHPRPNVLFELAEKMKITHFGTSAKYIDSLAKVRFVPKKKYPLEDLRMIFSTGSPLSPESYDYVYHNIKEDLCLASISGGTDIVSCFVLGNSIAPVWRGELQTAGLGMKVDVYNEEGKSVLEEKGELVCTQPFPCRPIGFWNDPGGEKYHQTYYGQYKNTWYHGDFVEKTNHGGFIFYGRSDAVLNPGGVRIGTAEIYRQVEQIPEVMESLAVGQNWKKDVRVVLFVRLKDEVFLNQDLEQRICEQIRLHTTPRHVPAKIIQIQDIPRTKSGKIAELAVRNMVHGDPVKNKEALANPESLMLYKDIPELQID